MSALMNPQPYPVQSSPLFPRCSPPRLGGSRKRKAEDDFDPRAHPDDHDSSMDLTPAAPRNIKKPRAGLTARPLPLSRLLETVDTTTLKTMLTTLSDRHPELAREIHELAPRPTVQSALATLHNYEQAYRAAFPYGGNSTGDYAYNRVRPALLELLDALGDYTPHFLPPNEAQHTNSLQFLDGATEIVHRLPEWENPLHNHARNAAYEEIAKAWTLVIQEAGKRGAGITLQYGGWEGRVRRHNEVSGGRMNAVVESIREVVGWEAGKTAGGRQGGIGFGMQSGMGVPVRTW